jgi:hypothetical protein
MIDNLFLFMSLSFRTFFATSSDSQNVTEINFSNLTWNHKLLLLMMFLLLFGGGGRRSICDLRNSVGALDSLFLLQIRDCNTFVLFTCSRWMKTKILKLKSWLTIPQSSEYRFLRCFFGHLASVYHCGLAQCMFKKGKCFVDSVDLFRCFDELIQGLS